MLDASHPTIAAQYGDCDAYYSTSADQPGRFRACYLASDGRCRAGPLQICAPVSPPRPPPRDPEPLARAPSLPPVPSLPPASLRVVLDVALTQNAPSDGAAPTVPANVETRIAFVGSPQLRPGDVVRWMARISDGAERTSCAGAADANPLGFVYGGVLDESAGLTVRMAAGEYGLCAAWSGGRNATGSRRRLVWTGDLSQLTEADFEWLPELSLAVSNEEVAGLQDDDVSAPTASDSLLAGDAAGQTAVWVIILPIFFCLLCCVLCLVVGYARRRRAFAKMERIRVSRLEDLKATQAQPAPPPEELYQAACASTCDVQHSIAPTMALGAFEVQSGVIDVDEDVSIDVSESLSGPPRRVL